MIRQELEATGFRILRRETLSKAPQERLLAAEKRRVGWLVKIFYTIGLVPQHLKDLLDQMTKGTDACIKAQQLKLITGDMVTVAVKPL